MDSFFTSVYETGLWGNNNNDEYKGSSGPGSSIDYNKHVYIPFLKNFIQMYNVKSIVDLGCGDFRCGPYIYDNLDVTYHGYDTYDKIIMHHKKNHSIPKYNFTCLDFYTYKENIVNGDLCILKDVLQHWKMEEIYSLLDYIVETKKFKYILVCNCCNQNIDNPSNETRFTGLSCDYLPLKKYNPVKMFNYVTKEVSIIQVY